MPLQNNPDLKTKIREAVASIIKETFQKIFKNLASTLSFVTSQKESFWRFIKQIKLMIQSFKLDLKAFELNYSSLRYEYFK